MKAESAFYAAPSPCGAPMSPEGYPPEYIKANAELARAIYDEAHARRA